MPKDDPESNLRRSSPPVTPRLVAHVANILLLTTIVRPTYSVYSLAVPHVLDGDAVSSSLTTRLPRFITAAGTTAQVDTDGSVKKNGEGSDEALMDRVCSGDVEALASLFHRYARIIHGLAYRVLRDASEAD